MSASDCAELMRRLAERARCRIRPERLDEASMLARDNVQAMEKDLKAEPLELVPAAFLSVLQRHDE